MGILSWLFGKTETPSTPAFPENVNFIRGPGEYKFDIVGESHYQAALEAICGPRKEDGEQKQVIAFLILEDSNPYDKFAVRIDIEGKTVGYMSKQSARSFRRQVEKANIPDNGLDLACYAMIRGGWDRGGGDKGHYGVWLDIPTED
jgi:hypothetical protein